MTKMLDTGVHQRLVAAQLKDPEFRDEYEAARREMEIIDSVIQQLDELREQAGLSKADLARIVGRNASSIRRLFTAQSNPELALVAAIAVGLGADIKVQAPKKRPARARRGELATA